MRALIITVAGMSKRFSSSIGKECVKCIYHEKDISESLLWRILHQPVEFDCYILVGGYRFEELKKVINDSFSDFSDRLVLLCNEQYEKYGSGYSLYVGLEYAVRQNFDEIVFAEGDLFVDTGSFVKLCSCETDAISCNSEAITADKAVAFYFDLQNRIHYIYDTGHSALFIGEPFLSIHNSGQIWKFADSGRIKETFAELGETDWQGTNLVFIERYFSKLRREDFSIVRFEKWINCNTISDFERI